MEDVLKPCPFCGGKPGYFASKEAVFRAEWVGHIYHCTKCQARVQSTDRVTAQSMWNARIDQQTTKTP